MACESCWHFKFKEPLNCTVDPAHPPSTTPFPLFAPDAVFLYAGEFSIILVAGFETMFFFKAEPDPQEVCACPGVRYSR
jgi:hypothetical protein